MVLGGGAVVEGFYLFEGVAVEHVADGGGGVWCLFQLLIEDVFYHFLPAFFDILRQMYYILGQA